MSNSDVKSACKLVRNISLCLDHSLATEFVDANGSSRSGALPQPFGENLHNLGDIANRMTEQGCTEAFEGGNTPA